jgi:uncharacterized tellurite resistance protein B-like protein
MFLAIKHFVAELSVGDKHPSEFEATDYRLAAAALMVHAASIDGNFDEAEREMLRAIIRQRFNLSEAETNTLLLKAEAAEHDAVDLYHFTSVLNRTLDPEGRRRIVGMMWEIVYADRKVTEFEENLIWRAADLLGVSSRERIELRREVVERMKGGGG